MWSLSSHRSVPLIIIFYHSKVCYFKSKLNWLPFIWPSSQQLSGSQRPAENLRDDNKHGLDEATPPPSLVKAWIHSYHLCQLQDHGAEAADVSVVPGVHHAQVGTQSARLAIPFMWLVLKIRTMGRGKKKINEENPARCFSFSNYCHTSQLLMKSRSESEETIPCDIWG